MTDELTDNVLKLNAKIVLRFVDEVVEENSFMRVYEGLLDFRNGEEINIGKDFGDGIEANMGRYVIKIDKNTPGKLSLDCQEREDSFVRHYKCVRL